MTNPVSPMYSNNLNPVARLGTGNAPTTHQSSIMGGASGMTTPARAPMMSSVMSQQGGYTTKSAMTTTSQYGGAFTPSNSQYMSGHQTVQSERVLSSNVLNETLLGPMPQEENVQYIEVPVIEEVIKHVPRKEVIEIEKRVPKYEYEWIEKIIEVPQVHIVDKPVEVPQVQEFIRHVPVKQYVDVPKEIIRHIPKIEMKIVEKEVEVPGEVIEVPKPYLVENKIVVPRYTDKEVPTVVAQKLVPVISESETDFVDVDLREFNPYLVPVDVYVPRPVARQLIASSKTEEHRVVDVPVGQFNSLLRQLNNHITETDVQELLVKDQRGAIPIMPITAGSLVVPPTSTEWETTHTKGSMRYNFSAPVGQITSTVLPAGTTTTTSTSYQKYPNTATNSFVSGGVYYGGATRTAAATTTYNSSAYTAGLQTASGGQGVTYAQGPVQYNQRVYQSGPSAGATSVSYQSGNAIMAAGSAREQGKTFQSYQQAAETSLDLGFAVQKSSVVAQ